MQKLLFILSIVILGCNYVIAQDLIAVEHSAGGSEFFTRLDSALVHSSNGDFIYLPGTPGINVGNIILYKGVNIIGAGINPDSCLATGITTLSGNLVIVSGADNGSLQGIYFTGNISFGTTHNDQHVSNFMISRCNFGNLNLSYNGTDTTTSMFLIRECILRGTVNGGYSNAVFRNNIFNQQLNYFTGASFFNNIFLYGSGNTINLYVRNTNFSNNILKNECLAYFGMSCATLYSFDNNYYNNIIPGEAHFYGGICGQVGLGCNPFVWYPFNGNGIWSGNLEYVPGDNIYINQSGNIYNYHHNYHLKSTSPGKNAGTDGTDIGIYGGSEPFKDGSMPINPHIQYKNVAGWTNPDGTLDIHFKVAAQDQ